MEDSSEHEILWNNAALTALRRPQLISLSKKYGLKANGKNVDMVGRLHDFGQTLTPASKTIFDYGVHSRAQKSQTETPSKKMPEPELSDAEDASSPPSPVKPPVLQHMPSIGSLNLNGRNSGEWEILTDGDSSLIADDVGDEAASTSTSSSKPLWKSAINGAGLEDPTAAKQISHRQSMGPGSFKSLGTSLRRAASRSLSMSLSTRPRNTSSSNVSVAAPSTLELSPGPDETQPDEPMQLDEDSVPPSPASAIGIAKRHSTITLHKRDSTIHLVTPTPFPVEIARAVSPEPVVDDDELPLTGMNSVDAIKKRRSIQFLDGPSSANQNGLNRRSMPVLVSPHAIASARVSSAPTAKLYPDLAAIQGTPNKAASPVSATTPLPGSFPEEANPASPGSPSFVFGAGNGTSSAAFSDAGIKLLEEMQAKMGGGAAFNPELLKGKRAEINKLVTTNSELGSGPTGGWGLSAGASAANDRFAKIHQREFSKMQSISSISTMNTNSYSSFRGQGTPCGKPAGTPGTKRKLEVSDSGREPASGSLPRLVNGLPAPAPTTDIAADMKKEREEDVTRSAKKQKTNAAPRYLASMANIRGASRAIANKLSDSIGPGGMTPRRMRSNLRTAPDSQSRSRFPFLGHKRNTSDVPSIADTVTSDDFVLAKIPAEKKDKSPTPKLSKRMSTLMSSTSSFMKPRQPSTGLGGPAAATRAPPSAAGRAISASQAASRIPASGSSRSISTSVTSSGPARVVSVKSVALSTATAPKSRAASASSGPPVSMVPLKDSSDPLRTARGLPPARPKSTIVPVASRTSASSGLAGSVASVPSRKASADSLASSAAPSVTSSSTSGDTRPTRPISISARSSSLLAPTVASLARMQASKPSASDSSASGPSSKPARPLPRPPKDRNTSGGSTTSGVSIVGIAPQIPTVPAFGAASSRANYLFESNFHFPAPDTKPAAPVVTPAASAAGAPGTMTPKRTLPTATTPSGIPRRFETPKAKTSASSLSVGKSPARATVASAQRARVRESGIGSIKARGQPVQDSSVAQRRADIKARQERIKQERELRSMLI